MTQLSHRTLNCPKCNTSFSIVYNASINTWMDPLLAKDFLEGKGYVFTCPSCNQNIRLVTTIIVNAQKGMFSISTDSSEEERKNLYQQYGLINEKGEFGHPRDEWMLHQLTKMRAPEDSRTQIRRQDKILEEIQTKLTSYKNKLKENSPLDETEEDEFNKLENQWVKERNKEENYLHHPKTAESTLNTSVLFHKLWEDLVKIKTELDKLK
ncbi:MAG: CpXC domain-containing protein [Promethearchaeota archaeon]